MAKQWGGRFVGKTDELVERLGESVSFDQRLAPWDIRASIAHARMLGKQGIIPKADSKKIIAGLNGIAKDIENGRFKFEAKLEDVHSNIETALIRRIGDAGKRLHTARSRNDQIATDVRLWARDQIDAIDELLSNLQHTFLTVAEKHVTTILPGCTHLQHAQPVLLAHHLLAYFEMFHRDRIRFIQLRSRVNIMPLGSAAMAGTPHNIDRFAVADELKFDAISANSMDAVSDRDYLIEFCSCAAITMMHLSRFCEELIIWSTPEFGFAEIADAYTTGSSIMPQKKNPDVAELVRGKAGRVYGDLLALLTLMKGLPLTYNRDMQEDKEPAFDASDTMQLCLPVVARMLSTIRFNEHAMREAAREGFLEATDVADYLVDKGVPFREAHGIAGKMVLHCIKHGKRLPELSLEEFNSFCPRFERDIFGFLKPETMVRRRDQVGGTAPRQVKAAIKRAREILKSLS
ncbi:MAG: argininosuccinate lyase [Candidatus Hydrogenedentes bacterium]|nr:argininosuccinate lyase [Candidatus Hydrogenedentota bacterium]